MKSLKNYINEAKLPGAAALADYKAAQNNKAVHDKIAAKAKAKSWGNLGLNSIYLVDGSWEAGISPYYCVKASDSSYAVFDQDGNFVEIAPSSFIQRKLENVATYKR